jgi:hypothetical protein
MFFVIPILIHLLVSQPQQTFLPLSQLVNGLRTVYALYGVFGPQLFRFSHLHLDVIVALFLRLILVEFVELTCILNMF